MTINYTRMQQTAQRLIEGNGRAVSFVKFDRSTPDNTKPWKGPLNPLQTPLIRLDNVKVVFIDTISSRYLGHLIQVFDNINAEDKFVMVATLSLSGNDGRTFDEIIDGGEHWKIESGNVLRPGDLEMFQALKITKRELYVQ